MKFGRCAAFLCIQRRVVVQIAAKEKQRRVNLYGFISLFFSAACWMVSQAAPEGIMLFIFVFLAGIIMFFGFGLWRFVGVTLLLMAGQTVWQSYLGTPASQIAVIVAAQTILLQLGYFLGLLMAYGRERIIGGEGFTALPVGEPLPKVVPLHGGSAEHLDS